MTCTLCGAAWIFVGCMVLDETKIAFIGCSPRSGSTLLIRLLNSHSKITSPCELAIPRYFQGDQEKELLVNQKYVQICKYYGVDLADALKDPKALLLGILKQEQKQFVVLKDPRQSLFLAQIHKDYPVAKLIFLVRDVRAVASSNMFQSHPIAGFERWYEYNSAVISVLRNNNSIQAHPIRYEDILHSAEETIAKLTEFLGYKFELSMLNYGDFHHADDDMTLWDGQPKTSPLQTSLQHGAIMPPNQGQRTPFSKTINDLYEKYEEVRKLNESFGYVT